MYWHLTNIDYLSIKTKEVSQLCRQLFDLLSLDRRSPCDHLPWQPVAMATGCLPWSPYALVGSQRTGSKAPNQAQNHRAAATDSCIHRYHIQGVYAAKMQTQCDKNEYHYSSLISKRFPIKRSNEFTTRLFTQK